MSMVIGLPKPKKANTAPVEGRASAQILFFTGVRYQRMIETAPADQDGRRPTREGGKRRRKRG